MVSLRDEIRKAGRRYKLPALILKATPSTSLSPSIRLRMVSNVEPDGELAEPREHRSHRDLSLFSPS